MPFYSGDAKGPAHQEIAERYQCHQASLYSHNDAQAKSKPSKCTVVSQYQSSPERVDIITAFSGRFPFCQTTVHCYSYPRGTHLHMELLFAKAKDFQSIAGILYLLLLRRCFRKERTQFHHSRRIDLAQLLDTPTRILLLCLFFFLFPFLGGFSFFGFFIVHGAALAGYVVGEGTHGLGASFGVGDEVEVCVERSKVDG